MSSNSNHAPLLPLRCIDEIQRRCVCQITDKPPLIHLPSILTQNNDDALRDETRHNCGEASCKGLLSDFTINMFLLSYTRYHLVLSILDTTFSYFCHLAAVVASNCTYHD